jgi:wobble nucleotide-excising tRNase
MKLVVIDDPVQSMDKKHSIGFVNVVEKILTAGYQMVLLSHKSVFVISKKGISVDD